MKQNYIQLFVRIAVATAFLSAVADRLGYWGAPGGPNVVWGNWTNFLAYSNQLNSYVSPEIGEMFAIAATALELVFALLLLVGLKTRITSFASGILLSLFAISMSMAFGLKSSFDYSVWIAVSACFLLGTVKEYHYSLDYYFKNESRESTIPDL